LMGLDSRLSTSGFQIVPRTTPTEESAGVGLNLAMPIMLQEFWPGCRPTQVLGTGASVCFMCEDALTLYREFKSRGIPTRRRPYVGNRLWVVPVTDPDGYRMDFESPTDAPEVSELSGIVFAKPNNC